MAYPYIYNMGYGLVWDPPHNPLETKEERIKRINAFTDWALRGFVIGCA